MVPTHILHRIARIQSELAAILLELPVVVAAPQPAVAAKVPAPAAVGRQLPPQQPAARSRRPLPPQLSPRRAPRDDNARWGFQPQSRYRIVGPTPFRPGLSADRFQAMHEAFGTAPFTYDALWKILTASGAAPTRPALVSLLQIARTRGALIAA